MTTLDKHSSVSVALALQLEGQAIMAGVSTDEYLQEILDKFGHKVFKSERTSKMREYVKKRNSEGATDTQIAREKGVSQQSITRHRLNLGLPKVVKTHCVNGHPYKGENLYENPKTGRRGCRACKREYWRDRKGKGVEPQEAVPEALE